jgi:hypothetical protein
MKKTNQQKAPPDQQKTLLSFWQNNKTDKNAESKNSVANKKPTIQAAPKKTGPPFFSSAFGAASSTSSKQTSSTRASTDDPILIDEDSNSNSTARQGYNYESMDGLSNMNFSEMASSDIAYYNDDNAQNGDHNDGEDMDDMELIQTTDTFLKEKSFNRTSFGDGAAGTSALNLTEHEIFDKNAEQLAIGIDDNLIRATQNADTEGFDANAGSVWIYPNNMPVRSYQYNIVDRCLHKNTMVVLPTGMGKTFIAAVVMYNFYRWYPGGKVVFMAPTKPLVTQQADACYKIVGIPKEDMTFMTGAMAPDKRKLLWASKRVFFITPQVISNDILRNNLDVNLMKCVVIDEAHRALGEYAFCKVS